MKATLPCKPDPDKMMIPALQILRPRGVCFATEEAVVDPVVEDFGDFGENEQAGIDVVPPKAGRAALIGGNVGKLEAGIGQHMLERPLGPVLVVGIGDEDRRFHRVLL